MLSLTGLPLLVASMVGAVGALTGTVLLWRRTRTGLVLRAGCLLACELTLLWIGALAVNRSLVLYPNWSTLTLRAPAPSTRQVDAAPAGGLDHWLAATAIDGAVRGYAFGWKPAGLASWHVAGAPVVFVPPAYFSQSTARFPVVVVVVAPGQPAWTTTVAAVLGGRCASAGTPAILVLLDAGRERPAGLVSALVPTALRAALRVSPRGWGVLADVADAPDALAALSHASTQFRVAALVATTGSGALPSPLSARAANVPGDQLVAEVTGAPAPATPAHSAPAHSDPPQPATVFVTVYPAAARIGAALSWLVAQLPAPLAAPIVGPVGTVPPRSARPEHS